MLSKISIVGAILVMLLLGWSYMSKPQASATWGSSSIQCLPNGHVGATYHVHTKLTIVVDNIPELIPSHIGDTAECMAEVHTHDASGTVHVEGVLPKEFTLSDFYAVWNKSIQREGYLLRASLNGVAVDDVPGIPLTDAADIVLTYSSVLHDQE